LSERLPAENLKAGIHEEGENQQLDRHQRLLEHGVLHAAHGAKRHQQQSSHGQPGHCLRIAPHEAPGEALQHARCRSRGTDDQSQPQRHLPRTHLQLEAPSEGGKWRQVQRRKQRGEHCGEQRQYRAQAKHRGNGGGAADGRRQHADEKAQRDVAGQRHQARQHDRHGRYAEGRPPERDRQPHGSGQRRLEVVKSYLHEGAKREREHREPHQRVRPVRQWRAHQSEHHADEKDCGTATAGEVENPCQNVHGAVLLLRFVGRPRRRPVDAAQRALPVPAASCLATRSAVVDPYIDLRPSGAAALAVGSTRAATSYLAHRCRIDFRRLAHRGSNGCRDSDRTGAGNLGGTGR
jgi:hypothetical protein